jgi:hypothetical protein
MYYLGLYKLGISMGIGSRIILVFFFGTQLQNELAVVDVATNPITSARMSLVVTLTVCISGQI